MEIINVKSKMIEMRLMKDFSAMFIFILLLMLMEMVNAMRLYVKATTTSMYILLNPPNCIHVCEREKKDEIKRNIQQCRIEM